MGSNPSQFTSSPATGEIQENRPVEQVSWYDAIVYCNKRSIAENLTPCYTINGSTNPADWGDAPNTTWDAVTCNFSANGYRLPTEAEWEYIARSGNGLTGTQTTYSGSDTVGDVAWYGYEDDWETPGNSGSITHEVKKKSANRLGIYDMSGNVREWCWDWYDSISSSTGAEGASSGWYRVLRGGSWGYDASYCRVADRGSRTPGFTGSYLGFRVVRSSSN